MTEADPAWMASANGHKYSSCMVLSSMLVETDSTVWLNGLTFEVSPPVAPPIPPETEPAALSRKMVRILLTMGF